MRYAKKGTSVLGRITHLEVDHPSSELLVSGELGQGVYLFSLTGALLSKMGIDECAPAADGFSVNSAVFASDDRMVADDGSRGHVFDRDGNCLVSKESFDFLTTQAICAQGDTIFAWQQARRDGRRVIGFSDQLEPEIQIDLPPPKSPHLVSPILFGDKSRHSVF